MNETTASAKRLGDKAKAQAENTFEQMTSAAEEATKAAQSTTKFAATNGNAIQPSPGLIACNIHGTYHAVAAKSTTPTRRIRRNSRARCRFTRRSPNSHNRGDRGCVIRRPSLNFVHTKPTSTDNPLSHYNHKRPRTVVASQAPHPRARPFAY